MTGNSFGCDTLASGGATNACVTVLRLPLMGAGAQHDCVSEEMRCYRRLWCICLIHFGALFFLARRGIDAPC